MGKVKDLLGQLLSFVWNKADEVLPEKDGDYVVIPKNIVVDGWLSIRTLPFDAEVGKFNYSRGSDLDTSIEVLYWAEVENLLPLELKEGAEYDEEIFKKITGELKND